MVPHKLRGVADCGPPLVSPDVMWPVQSNSNCIYCSSRPNNNIIQSGLQTMMMFVQRSSHVEHIWRRDIRRTLSAGAYTSFHFLHIIYVLRMWAIAIQSHICLSVTLWCSSDLTRVHTSFHLMPVGISSYRWWIAFVGRRTTTTLTLLQERSIT